MRNISIAPNEYYHLFNRGVLKQDIFLNDRDRVRFLFALLHFQSNFTLTNPEYYVNNYIEHRVFNISKKTADKILEDRSVELTSFCLMPNHFHLLVLEKNEGGIAKYMQRILNAYTKYFNTKYKKSGHLFQGPYKAVHVESNSQLLHLSAYIHRNPRELAGWKNKEENYQWSSYQDYTKDNRWGDLLAKEIIEGQFDDKNDYKEFLETSPAKIGLDELG
ncbi:MAG: transposase [bacterium]|nr:transposase [bacterium]